jgi:phosphatidylinositol alpha-1,6-mannosyltransferase
MRRVLFVSKPIVPPFHDGTKCLVRDVSQALTRHRAIVMGTRETDPSNSAARPGIDVAAVYGNPGAFTPALVENARAAAWLLLRSRADVWHFVFAPNPRTSTVARVARAVRRVPTLQTVASPPQRFNAGDFFGDIVVAQSQWTKSRIEDVFERTNEPLPRLEVIPPPIGAVAVPSSDAVARLRRELHLDDDAKVFVYPGDLEVGRGARLVADAVTPIVRMLDGAVVVFACRHKTAAAPAIEDALRAELDPRVVRFVREVHLPTLLAASTAVLFPVDDLRGKVDLPISLLEAMRLGVPIVTLTGGPLADLEGVMRVDQREASEIARAAVALVENADLRSRIVAEAHAAVATRFDASVVAAAYERLYDALLL